MGRSIVHRYPIGAKHKVYKSEKATGRAGPVAFLIRGATSVRLSFLTNVKVFLIAEKSYAFSGILSSSFLIFSNKAQTSFSKLTMSA